MRTLGSLAVTISAAALIGGCGGSPLQVGAPGAIRQSRAIATHADRGGPWMLPEAKSEDLLYIADYGGGVIVYSYRPGDIKQVGYLAAPLYGEGECVDKNQNVFITASNYEIYEYAHATTTPKAVLTDPFAHPLNCASDPTTGNLAVAGYSDERNGEGIAIFEHARGRPKLYPDTGFSWACSYDDQGNLFMDGSDRVNFSFAELPKGSKNVINIQLDQSFSFAGGVQWDGKYVAVGDYYHAVIYEFSISGSTGTEVGSTPLTGAGTVSQFLIDRMRGKVIVPSTFQFYAGFVQIFDYPAGGKARHTMHLGSPDGVAVSLASS